MARGNGSLQHVGEARPGRGSAPGESLSVGALRGEEAAENHGGGGSADPDPAGE